MKSLLSSWFAHAVDAVHPRILMQQAVSLNGETLCIRSSQKERRIDLSEFRRVLVVGYGKASVDMALALEHILRDRICGGVVVTKEAGEVLPQRVKVLYASHPVPDHRSLTAGARVLEYVESADAATLLIHLVSGGGSSLLEHISFPLEALQHTTEELLRSGASIQEMNTVRRHLSLIKGGKLAESAWPARSLSLVISDVIGDSFEAIASGPMVQDLHSVEESRSILQHYTPDLLSHIAPYLHQSNAAKEVFALSEHFIIGNNRLAVATIAQLAASERIPTLVLGSRIRGEARYLGTWYASIAEGVLLDEIPSSAPFCVIGGGESTVRVKGKGKGGRNQELALGFVVDILQSPVSYKDLAFLSAGTDGRDGPTDVAGVYVDRAVLEASRSENPASYLADNNSYEFFQRVGGAIHSGPTGTNVCDLHILLLLK